MLEAVQVSPLFFWRSNFWKLGEETRADRFKTYLFVTDIDLNSGKQISGEVVDREITFPSCPRVITRNKTAVDALTLSPLCTDGD